MTQQMPISRGERAPDFVLPVSDGTRTRFYAHAGGAPTVLIFTPRQTLEIRELIQTIQSRLPAPDVFVIQTEEGEKDATVTTFRDTEGNVRQAYRIAQNEQIALVLDTNLRVLSTHAITDAAQQEIIQTLSEIHPITSQTVATQAPILLIPNVLTPDICQALINVWDHQGNEETGIEQSVQQRRQDIISHTNKKRRDHIVTDEKLMRLISTTVGRRVMSELKKAFHFEATRFEGFKIVCYDAKDQGFFHAHRDNLSPSTAHRRFALTINLNDGFDGGHLTFPEYGPLCYKPKQGEAIVFSCNHLHEVTPVTNGKRFALLSFLFGENDIRQT